MVYGLPQLRQRTMLDNYGMPQYGDDMGQDPFFDPPTPPPPPESYNPYDPNQAPGTPGRGVNTPMDAPPSPPPQADPAQGTSLQGWFDAMNQGFTPSTFDRDRYRGVLDQFPERRQGSAVTAALIGLGERNRQGGGDPVKAMDQVLYGQGDRDIEDWKAKTTPYYNAAQLEGTANNQERQVVGNAVTGYMADKRIAEQARQANERFEIQRQTNEIRNAVAHGWENITGPNDPTYKLRNKATGEIRETKVPTGSMIEVDAIRERGAQQIEAARQTGAAAAERQSQGIIQRGDNLFEFPDGSLHSRNSDGSWKLEKPPGTGPARRPGTARTETEPNTLEKRRIENDKLKDFHQLDEEARTIIQKEGDTYNFKKRPVAHPDTWWPGDHVPQESVDRYDRIRKRIDPNYVPPSAPSTGNPAPGERPIDIAERARKEAGKKPIGGSNKVPQAAKPAAGGMVRMQTPDGKRIVMVPADRVKEAESKGGRRVQ